MTVPRETKRIYASLLKHDRAAFSENITWAYPESYKVYICDPEAYNEVNTLQSMTTIMAPSTVDILMDYVIEVFLLRPGNITELRKP